MFEDLKKRSFKKSLVGTIILLLLGAFILFVSWEDAYYAVTGYAQFEKLAPEEIKSQSVTFDMTTNFGYYLEQYEYNEKTKLEKTTDLYYVIWTGDDYATDYRYMTIKVPVSMKAKMEAMAENTYNDLLSEPITIQGKIRKLSDEEYQYFVEFFTEGGWTEQEVEEGTLPYYIDPYSSVLGNNIVYIGLFILGILLLIWAVYRLIKGAKGGFLKQFNQDIADAGYTQTSIASDYNRAFVMTKDKSIRIGRVMFYYEILSIIRAVPVDKILWAYQNTTTHRTNGIKTGTTYSVVVHTASRHKKVDLAVDNQEKALEVLNQIGKMYPWVVIGYSDELANTFNKDRAAFLNLRYNTCDHVAVEPGFEEFSSAAQ